MRSSKKVSKIKVSYPKKIGTLYGCEVFVQNTMNYPDFKKIIENLQARLAKIK